MSFFATRLAAVAIVPSPPTTTTRFVPASIASLTRVSTADGSISSKSNPAFFIALRAASALPHLEFRKALSLVRGGEVVAIKREAGGGKGKAGLPDYLYKKD